MEIVLHIGTDKTGSTSIQKAAFANREWLAGHSIYLPATGSDHGKDKPGGKGHESRLRQLDAEKLRGLAGELRQAADQGYHRALLSWEGMGSRQFGRREIRSLQAALDGFEITVLVYLREQAEIIQSGILQRVKQNTSTLEISAVESPRSPAEKLRSLVALRNPNRNYYRLLRRWQRGIPRATFSVRIFEQAQLRDGDLIGDFLAQIGVARDEGFVEAGKIYNPSLDVEGALVLESLRRDHPEAYDMETFLDITQSVINLEGTSTRYFLSEKAVAGIRSYFRRSNLRLAREFMAGGSYPFRTLRDCWRHEGLAGIESRAAVLLGKVEKLRQVPTLMGQTEGEAIASEVELCAGWARPVSWGVWSIGTTSRIRFRVYRHRLLQEEGALRLHIDGRYYGDNTKTRVSINGTDYGELALVAGSGTMEIPVAALQNNEVIEIVLVHQQPISPAELEGKSDKRALAFGIEKLAYSRVGL